MNIASLNKKFAIGAELNLKQLDSGITLIEINTLQAAVTISLEGGQIITWHPKSQNEPVLWVSKLAHFVPGKAIHARVPICWPWFGAHPSNSDLPGHGFARVVPWVIESTSGDIKGIVDIKLSLGDSREADRLRPSDWPKSVSLSVHYRIVETLKVSLVTENNSEHEVRFTDGLHTYFHMSDIENVRVHGLDECIFIDLIDGNRRLQQTGPTAFGGEVGRIFVGCDKATVIEDRALGRCIQVVGAGSNSIAVWNPGFTTASKMPDLGAEGWWTMVCLEAANTLENAIRIAPGDSHSTTAIYSVAALT